MEFDYLPSDNVYKDDSTRTRRVTIAAGCSTGVMPG
jgi:hypothetical protein